ncbi:SdiA-regulated domain-containing protein [Pseudocnuella soli]|uniref:SdiA-regulated domain-containing protein n=1 Tax=Pseudocnuella soli TaxID=2502779 RepID=UPI00104C018F|nr:SdiA-regulated domain-containing protein [Pseudocnuella soli]
MMRKLFQTGCPAPLWMLLVPVMLCSACSDNSYSSPRGYDLHRPVVRELGKSLNEISGIFYVPGEDALVAIADSKDNIFRIDLRREKLTDKVKDFYEQEDFEDIVQLDSSLFVLISNGSIVEVPLQRPDSVNVFALNPDGKNDFESLYYDPVAKGLIMLCKECDMDDATNGRSAFRFDLENRRFDSEPFYTINDSEVMKVLKNDDVKFKPSAAAIHPLEGRLYILASAGQVLVIADRRGNVAEVYRLNPDQHPQAEGIAFAPNGTMYISNEGKYGSATLKMYNYNKALQRQTQTKK